MSDKNITMLAAAFAATLSSTAPNMAQADNTIEDNNTQEAPTLTVNSTQDEVRGFLEKSRDSKINPGFYVEDNLGTVSSDLTEKYNKELAPLAEQLSDIEDITKMQIVTALSKEACNYTTSKDLKQFEKNGNPIAKMAKGDLENFKSNCQDLIQLQYTFESRFDIEIDEENGVPIEGLRGGKYYPPKADYMRNAAETVVNSVNEGCESMSPQERLDSAVYNANKTSREITAAQNTMNDLGNDQIKQRLEIAESLIGTFNITAEGVDVKFGSYSYNNVNVVEFENAQQELAKNPENEKSNCQVIDYSVGMID